MEKLKNLRMKWKKKTKIEEKEVEIKLETPKNYQIKQMKKK